MKDLPTRSAKRERSRDENKRRLFWILRTTSIFLVCTTIVASYGETRILQSLSDGMGFLQTNLNVTTTSWRTIPATADATPDIIESTTTRRLCQSDELRRGEWRKVVLDKPPFIPAHSKCYSVKELRSATEWTDHRWHPFAATNYCEYEPEFSNTEYCRLAHNKTIGFMGDSLTWEHYASLASRLGLAVGAHDQTEFRSSDGTLYQHQKGFVMDVCNGTSRIAFMRNRYLLYLDAFLELADPDVVLINTGAHAQADKNLLDGFPNKPNQSGLRCHLNHLSNLQERKRKQGRSFLTIWRTSAPGHHSCSGFKDPATNVSTMEHYIQDLKSYPPGFPMVRNHWHGYQHQNEVVLQEFQNYNHQRSQNNSTPQLNYEILHGYDANILRPDAHVGGRVGDNKDCLHNCDPGPADVYNSLLLHLLRLHENDES